MKQEEMERIDKEADAELEALASGASRPSETADATPPAGEKPAETGGTGKPEDTAPAGTASAPETTAPVAEKQPEKPAATAQAPEETVESLKGEVAKWQEEARLANERYAAVNGKYMAEVPRYKTEIERLKPFEALVAEKDAEIAQLKAKATSTGTSSPGAKPSELFDKAIERARDEHGDDIADVLVDFAAPMETLINDLKTKLQTATTELEELKKNPPAAAAAPATGTESPEESFYKNLTLRIPDWPEINKDPKWLEFLAKPEPTSGLSYQELLNLHHGNGNVGGDGKTFGVADIFDRYRKSAPVSTSTTTAKSEGFEALAEHVDPSTVAGENTTSAKEKPKIIPKAEVDQFFDTLKKRPQDLRMTQAEILAKQAEYDQADLEGRVR